METVATKLGIPMDRVITNLDEYVAPAAARAARLSLSY